MTKIDNILCPLKNSNLMYVYTYLKSQKIGEQHYAQLHNTKVHCITQLQCSTTVVTKADYDTIYSYSNN